MKISVKQRHIKEGRRNASMYCPIALATQEAAGTENCGAGPCKMWIGDNFYSLPPSARDFVNYFDRGFPVAPFEFEIEL